jgi:hypothetical protein
VFLGKAIEIEQLPPPIAHAAIVEADETHFKLSLAARWVPAVRCLL